MINRVVYCTYMFPKVIMNLDESQTITKVCKHSWDRPRNTNGNFDFEVLHELICIMLT